MEPTRESPAPAPKRPMTPGKLILAALQAPVYAARKPTTWSKVSVGTAGVLSNIGLFTNQDILIIIAMVVLIITSLLITHQRAVLLRQGDPDAKILWFYATGVVLAFPLAYVVLMVLTAAIMLALVAGLGWLGFRLFQGSRSPAPKVIVRGSNSHINADGSSKLEYRSATAAANAATEYERDFGGKMSTYKCADGTHYHIGHDRPSKQ